MTATGRLYTSLTRRLRAMGSPARAEKEKSYQKPVWQRWGVALPQMDVAIRSGCWAGPKALPEHGATLKGVASREASKHL